MLSIGEVEVAAFFRELPGGRFRVSLRSKGKLDVARVAECFGGGGHQCASGCSLDGPLAQAVRPVLEMLGGVLPYNETSGFNVSRFQRFESQLVRCNFPAITLKP